MCLTVTSREPSRHVACWKVFKYQDRLLKAPFQDEVYAELEVPYVSNRQSMIAEDPALLEYEKSSGRISLGIHVCTDLHYAWILASILSQTKNWSMAIVQCKCDPENFVAEGFFNNGSYRIEGQAVYTEILSVKIIAIINPGENVWK